MIWKPMVKTGFNDVIGSWKIMAISLPRIDRISAPLGSRSVNTTSLFDRRYLIRPASIQPGGRIKPMTASAVTLFPQPDSPTTPKVFPGSTPKLTPSTARIVPNSV